MVLSAAKEQEEQWGAERDKPEQGLGTPGLWWLCRNAGKCPPVKVVRKRMEISIRSKINREQCSGWNFFAYLEGFALCWGAMVRHEKIPVFLPKIKSR